MPRPTWLGAVLVVVASAAVAAAEPAKPAKPTTPPKPDPWAATPPPIAIDLGPDTQHDPATRSPGINGFDALGRVLVPGPHPDARPYPEGMLITPPKAGDRNVLVPGSNQLPWWDPAGPRPSARLLDRFERGVGEVLRWIIPQPS